MWSISQRVSCSMSSWSVQDERVRRKPATIASCSLLVCSLTANLERSTKPLTTVSDKISNLNGVKVLTLSHSFEAGQLLCELWPLHHSGAPSARSLGTPWSCRSYSHSHQPSLGSAGNCKYNRINVCSQLATQLHSTTKLLKWQL